MAQGEFDEGLQIQVPFDGARFASLSPAERAIAKDVVAGHDTATIARHRGVAVRTVANQLANLFHKLGVQSRRELVLVLVHRA